MARATKFEVILEPQALLDLKFWRKNKPEVIARISRLVDAIQQSPFSGIGKPKALRYDFEGLWSRRIDKDHRVIYEVRAKTIHVLSLRGHYGDK